MAVVRPAEPMPNPRLTAIASMTLLVLVAVIFTQLGTHQYLNYDDDFYVTANAHVKAGLTLEGVRWAFTSMDFNWHPLTWLSHMVDVELFGVHAGPALLVNAGLHAVNAILLLLLLVRMTRAFWRSFFVAALFAVHPLHVESVAWLAERKDVLSTLFFLLTLLLYVRFAETRSKTAYAGMVLTFAAGLMCKGMLVTLPFVLLLLDYWPLRRLTKLAPREIGRLALEKLPLFVLVIPAVILTYDAQRAVSAIVRTVPLGVRLANAALSYVAYIGKTFWPAGLIIPYPYRLRIVAADAIAALVLLAAISVAAMVLRKKCPWLFTGWFWFAGMLVPVIGIVQIGIQSMADRYTYVPSIGLFIAITWLVSETIARWPVLQRPVGGIAVVVIVVLTIAAHAQASYWKTSETLFRHTLSIRPDSVDAHLGLGKTLLDDHKNAPAAVREFQAAVALFPTYAAGHHDLGAAYGALGRYDDAAREYRRAIELEPTAQRYQQLATIEMKRGNRDEAAALLTSAGALLGDPVALAKQALARGDVNGALAKFADAIQRQPDSPDLHNDYGAALAKAGRDDEAIQQYREAIALKASFYDAHMNLGAILSRHDRNADAITEFETAEQLRPAATEPKIYLALALAQAGDRAQAAAKAQAALAIDEKRANDQLTSAVRLPANPQNLRQFIASMLAR